MIIPNVELIMETPRKHHADEVAHEQRQDEELLAVGDLDLVQLPVDREVLPPVSGTAGQSCHLASQQENVEDAGHEDVLRQEAEVDSPLVEEDPAEVERSYDVLLGVGDEEGEAEY